MKNPFEQKGLFKVFNLNVFMQPQPALLRLHKYIQIKDLGLVYFDVAQTELSFIDIFRNTWQYAMFYGDIFLLILFIIILKIILLRQEVRF